MSAFFTNDWDNCTLTETLVTFLANQGFEMTYFKLCKWELLMFGWESPTRQAVNVDFERYLESSKASVLSLFDILYKLRFHTEIKLR